MRCATIRSPMCGPGGIFVGEDGRFVYVASVVGDFIHLIGAGRGQVVEDVVIGTTSHRFAATPDGKELLVSAELSGEVYISPESFPARWMPVTEAVGHLQTFAPCRENAAGGVGH